MLIHIRLSFKFDRFIKSKLLVSNDCADVTIIIIEPPTYEGIPNFKINTFKLINSNRVQIQIIQFLKHKII